MTELEHWFHEHMRDRTFGQWAADAIASVIGSWSFLIWQNVLIVIWCALNLVAWRWQWDPYPFILLNLVFSWQAANTGPILQMTGNRAAERDRAQADADYKTNVEAKLEIEQLQLHIARIEIEHLNKIIAQQSEMMALLNKMMGNDNAGARQDA